MSLHSGIYVLWPSKSNLVPTLLPPGHTLNSHLHGLNCPQQNTSFPSTPHNVFWWNVYETDTTLIAAQAGSSEPERPHLLQRTLEHSAAHSSMSLSLQSRKESKSGRIWLLWKEAEPGSIADSPESHWELPSDSLLWSL